MKSAFMVQRPEKLFIHSDTGPPTGRWKDLFQLEGGKIFSTGRWTDDEYGRRASLMESLSFFSIILEILFDFPPVVLLILSLETFQTLAATFADPWVPRGSAGSFKTLGTN